MRSVVARKAAVDRSKRIHVSTTDEVYESLEDWALQQGRPVANLATFLLERSVAQAKETGEYKPSKGHESKPRPKISALDVQKLADQLGIPSDRLLKAVKEIKLEVVNGCQVND